MSKVKTYIAAQRTVNALRRAGLDDPALQQDPGWRVRVTQASVRARLAYGRLTGSDIGRVKRELARGR